ncbi:MAG: restriction endonuclease subunit S [Candidatus Calescibacterium sp.]
MAVFSIVKLSELEGAKRLDAEYYRPEYLWIKSLPNAVPLRKITNDVRYGLYVEPEYKEVGINFIRALNLLYFWIDGEILKIEENKVPDDYRLNIGDCLIVRSGANTGSVGFVFPTFQGSTFGSYTIKISFNKINPAYGAIFLASKYGLSQAIRLKTGSAQLNLNIPNILQIKVPVLSEDVQKEIENIVWQVYELQQFSRSIYSQAEFLLLEELGLKDFKPKYEKTYTDKLSDAFSAHGIDAEYFQPAYEEVIKLLMKKVKVEKLKNVVSFISHGKQPYYVENVDIPVLIQKHLGSQLLSLYSEIVNMPDTPRTDREFVKKYPEYLIKPFDVLFYSVGAYLGRANVVLENFEAVPASFITLIRTKQEVCNPVYLSLFLNSKIGQLQSSRWKSASAQQYIYPKEIKEFIIPILPLSIQQEIASLVQQSHEARKKAKELLELAKRAVEIAIE